MNYSVSLPSKFHVFPEKYTWNVFNNKNKLIMNVLTSYRR